MAGRSGMARLLSYRGQDGQDTEAGPGRWVRGRLVGLKLSNGLEGFGAGAAPDRGLRQGLLGNAELAAAGAGAGEQVPRAGRGRELLLGVAPEVERGVQVGEHPGVHLGELVADGRLRPAGPLIAGDLEADLGGEAGVVAVVVAALPRGVLDLAG